MASYLGEHLFWYKRSGVNNPTQADVVLPENFLDETEVVKEDQSLQIAGDTIAFIRDEEMSRVVTQSAQSKTQLSDKEAESKPFEKEINQNSTTDISVVNVVTKTVQVKDSSYTNEFGILSNSPFQLP